MKWPAALIVALGGLAFAACAGARGQIRQPYPPPREGLLSCEMKAPNAVRLGDPLPLTMTVRNLGQLRCASSPRERHCR